jgi:DNA polymerase-3 subunit alpha
MDILESIKRILFKYRGETPVYVYMEASNKMVKANKDLWVNVNDRSLFDELIQLLGEENVKII